MNHNKAKTPRRDLRRVAAEYGPAALLILLLLAAWQIATAVWDIQPWLLPSPSDIASASVEARELLVPHILQTGLETLTGFGAALLAGLALALLMDSSSGLRRAVYPLLVISQTIPIIAIAPLLVIWFGYGILPKLIVVGLVCFFPIVVGAADGLRSTDPDLITLLQSMGATRRQIFLKVRVPASLPGMFTGIKVAITYSVVGAIIGEWVGASRGLGVFMLRASNSFRTDWVFASIAVVSILSLVLFLAVVVVERAALPWFYTKAREEVWEEM
jgi:ABC-type nitrate/sulfonate/bicarbonate transport system permease component